VVWFTRIPTEHPVDLTSGAFHGMALAGAVRWKVIRISGQPGYATGDAVLVGAVDSTRWTGRPRLGDLVCREGVPGECVYVHVDLDVLTPASSMAPARRSPRPGLAEVAAAIEGSPLPVIGAGDTECAHG